MTRKSNIPNGLEAIARKEAQIRALGGTVPLPWPWAVYGEQGKKKYVDVGLRLLQLTEMLDALKQFGAAVQREKAKRDNAIAELLDRY